MITVTKKIEITNGTAPYTYVWSTDNNCVTFTEKTGTITGDTITTDITFTDEACITAATITLTVTDSTGCISAPLTVSVSNVCDNLVLGSISETSDLTFLASASSDNCNSLTIDWEYEQAIFREVSRQDTPFTSALQLELQDGVQNFPATLDIIATVTDCNGCVKEGSYTYSFCTPTATNIQADVLCVNYTNVPTGAFYVKNKLILPELTGCSGITTDYSTIEFEVPNSKITVLTADDADNTDIVIGQRAIAGLLAENEVAIIGTYDITPGLYLLKYSMRTTDGIRSIKGTVIARFVACGDGKTIAAPDKSINVDCTSLSAGDTLSINIENEVQVIEGSTIDWSSWELVTPPTPTSTTITLGTNSDGDHVIEYVLPTPIVDDAFAWIICDTDGLCSTSTVYTVVDCIDAPTANDDAVTAVCNTSTTHTVLDNDLGNGSPIDVQSIVITEDPSKGTVVVVGDGTIIYTADYAESGSDTYKYTVKNLSGATSNEATVTVTINCAGQDASLTICN